MPVGERHFLGCGLFFFPLKPDYFTLSVRNVASNNLQDPSALNDLLAGITWAFMSVCILFSILFN